MTRSDLPTDGARPSALTRVVPVQRRPPGPEVDPLHRGVTGHVTWLDVPTRTYLTLRGRGAPSHDDGFARAVHTLVGLDRACRTWLGVGRDVEDEVPWTTPPEARWWVGGADPHAFRSTPPPAWCWEVLVQQPDALHTSDLRPAFRLLQERAPWRLHHVRVERRTEGECAQTLHVGPYGSAGPALRLLRSSLDGIGATRRGPLHEIYLDDPRHVPTHCVRTLLRQPLTPVDQTGR